MFDHWTVSQSILLTLKEGKMRIFFFFSWLGQKNKTKRIKIEKCSERLPRISFRISRSYDKLMTWTLGLLSKIKIESLCIDHTLNQNIPEERNRISTVSRVILLEDNKIYIH